jgi:prepilin-type N-terminal cleavage/methylation domain-containing protein
MKKKLRQYDLSFEVLKGRRKGFSLAEVLTTVVIIVILTLVSLPAINGFMDSMSSSGSVEVMINAALSNARAMAISQQRYVGIRFQKEYSSDEVLKSKQYLIFIESEEPKKMGNLTKGGYRAIDGIKPIKLPENIEVTDMIIGETETPVNDDAQILNNIILSDMTAFSIVFSPEGSLVVKEIRARNKDGFIETGSKISSDEVFNTRFRVESKNSQFYQDDYYATSTVNNGTVPDLGFGPELSRKWFFVYDKNEFIRAYRSGSPYSGYLNQIVQKPIYVSPYTGKLISTE